MVLGEEDGEGATAAAAAEAYSAARERRMPTGEGREIGDRRRKEEGERVVED